MSILQHQSSLIEAAPVEQEGIEPCSERKRNWTWSDGWVPSTLHALWKELRWRYIGQRRNS